jgi:hypothetical protein
MPVRSIACNIIQFIPPPPPPFSTNLSGFSFLFRYKNGCIPKLLNFIQSYDIEKFKNPCSIVHATFECLEIIKFRVRCYTLSLDKQ